MRVYCTSKNTGPSWQLDPVYMVYLGTSFDEAIAAVEGFVKYETEKDRFPREFADAYTALPRGIAITFVRFYAADGWWYSIVEFELEETNEIQT